MFLAFIRTIQYHVSDEPVSALIEIWKTAEAFHVPGRRPLDSFYANIEQSALDALVGEGGVWSDPEVLQLSQATLDANEDWGGMGIVLALAPPKPAPPPEEVSAEESGPAPSP